MKSVSTQAPQPTPPAVPIEGLEPAVGTVRSAQWLGRYRRSMLPVAGTLVVLAGQLAEDLGDSPPLQMLSAGTLVARWLLVGLVAYLFAIWGVEERTVERSLAAARPAVKIGDAEFDRYARRMGSLPLASEAILVLLSGAITVMLFVILGADLLFDDPVTHASRSLPFSLAGALIVAGYTVVGWAFLRLVYGTARLAAALGRLTREPLEINVFDTSQLLPFGNIALALALAPAGAIVILLIALGQPTTPVGWSVLIEATAATVLALLLPLRGIHRQMSSAKNRAFTALSAQITDVYGSVTSGRHTDSEEWSHLGGVTGTVMQLRKAVQEMTTWPFRDTLALSRALLIATAPLIYTTLSELIKILWITPLTRP